MIENLESLQKRDDNRVGLDDLARRIQNSPAPLCAWQRDENARTTESDLGDPSHVGLDALARTIEAARAKKSSSQ